LGTESQVRIILVRHGETVHNKRKAFAGKIDSPLTELGRKQAEKLGNFFRETRFSRIYASPLRRALDTALEIERRNLKGARVEIVPALIEKYSGRLEGKEHRQVSGEIWKKMRKHPADIFERIEGGESMEDVRKRVAPIAKALLSEKSGTYGIVAHGGTVRALFSELTGFPLNYSVPFKFDNCSITDIVVDRKLSRIFAAAVNSTSHLMETSPEKRKKRRFETRLLLIRHGKTRFNSQLLMQGKSNIPLSEEGFGQARALGKFLSGERIDRIYSSPLKRAFDTAQAISISQSGRRIQVTSSPLLIERDFGRFEGKPLKEWISWREKSGRSDYIDKSHKGESQKDVEKRVEKFLKAEILGKNRGKTVAIVSHGNTLRVFISKILRVHPEKTRPFFTGNAKFTEIIISEERGGAPRVYYFNEGAHLSGQSEKRLDA